jgi:hypothetical protein
MVSLSALGVERTPGVSRGATVYSLGCMRQGQQEEVKWSAGDAAVDNEVMRAMVIIVLSSTFRTTLLCIHTMTFP